MKRLVVGGAVVAFLVIGALASVRVRALYRHGKVDENGLRIYLLATVLADQQPSEVDKDAIAKAISAAGQPPATAIDAWGRPFEVWVGADEAGVRHYTIRSLGADGRLGPCCVGRWLPMNEADGDWVLADRQLVNKEP